jgi:Transposase zinc-binding domain
VHMSLAQLKVMLAIETCRTAALGGHIESCEDCGHRRIAYNSCIMGKCRNGELAAMLSAAKPRTITLAPITDLL